MQNTINSKKLASTLSGYNSSINFLIRAVLGLIFCPVLLYAQPTALDSYIILAGDSTCPSQDCGVDIGSSNTYVGGTIGSYNSISASYQLNHSGGLYSLNHINLFTDATVTSDIWSANSNLSNQPSLTVGHRANLKGSLYINGNTIIQAGTILGQVTHPIGTYYKGPLPQGGEVQSSIPFNSLPDFPPVTNFATAGSKVINSTQTIIPGAYGSLSLNGDHTITFSGPGDYIFSDIQNSGYLNTLVFDFQNTSTGNIRILIHGDVELGKIKVDIINGGDASRVIAETHGTGATSADGKTAWRQTPGWIGSNIYSYWQGTIWAPFGNIRIGGNTSRASFTGSLLSKKKVIVGNGVSAYHIPFSFCDTLFSVNIATPDSITCTQNTVVLNATTNAANATYSWHTPNGSILSGVNSLNPTINKGGIYTLTVSLGNGCSQSISVSVPQSECVIPYYPPPTTGKTSNIIGSELTSLSQNVNFNDTAGNIFVIDSGSVYIEVIAVQGQYQSALNLLQTPAYGLTNIIDNGPASLLITGLFPIQNLQKLDSIPHLINYVRPLFPPVVNSGIALSQGDAVMRAPFVRLGYDVYGEGTKVGVISNSFNTQPGNPAQTDISNEDLPGPGNPNNPHPVSVLQDFPFGMQSDEGRANASDCSRHCSRS